MITMRLNANEFRITHIKTETNTSSAPGRMPYAPTFGWLLELTLAFFLLSDHSSEPDFCFLCALWGQYLQSLVLPQHRAAAALRAAQAGVFPLGLLGVLFADL